VELRAALPIHGPPACGATERLPLLPDGRLLYRLKRRWRDGTSHTIFDPLDLVGKLAALVPPPRFNLVRYHGVLASSAAWRFLIVPEAADDEKILDCLGLPSRPPPIAGAFPGEPDVA
jgi:hypothetical protein